eukprot:748556-Hanusia_phi.AAC.2
MARIFGRALPASWEHQNSNLHQRERHPESKETLQSSDEHTELKLPLKASKMKYALVALFIAQLLCADASVLTTTSVSSVPKALESLTAPRLALRGGSAEEADEIAKEAAALGKVGVLASL